MIKLMKKIFFLCNLLIVFNGCNSASQQYLITMNGIYSKEIGIQQFSISQFKAGKFDSTDIRPKDHTEIMRYCCSIRPGKTEKMSVLFKDTLDYKWEYCKLDTSLVDSNYNGSTVTSSTGNEIPNTNLSISLPFRIEKGYVYQIFGLTGVNGSFYFSLNNENELFIQFHDQGPF